MAKFCPLCDGEVKGPFCPKCKSFITPYEAERNFRLNESHDESTPGKDPDCDYHQTSTKKYYTQPDGVKAEDYMNPKPQRSEADFENSLRPKSLAPKGGGALRPTPAKKNNSALKAVVVIWVMMILFFVFGIITSVLVSLRDSSEPDNEGNVMGITEDPDEVAIESVPWALGEEPSEETTNIRDQFKPSSLAEEEYESLLEENGFDEDGYKDADYDEIMEAGEPCNGWIHFERDGKLEANTICSILKAGGQPVSFYELSDEYMQDNYYYMDTYGDVYSHFKTFAYYTIDDESYEQGYNGFIYFVSDTVTGDLMYVGVNTDDLTSMKKISNCVLRQLASGEGLLEVMKNFDSEFDEAVESGDGYGYLEYGNLYYDITYYEEVSDDYYQYQSYIYLGEEEE